MHWVLTFTLTVQRRFSITLTMYYYLLFALFYPLLANAFPAAGQMSRPGKDLALFFAVSNYDQWDDLQNPVKDAEAIAGDLNKYYAFDTLIVRNPTYDKVIEVLNRYTNRTYAADGQLFVFFTGHGYLNSVKEGFFVPKDGKKNDVSQQSYLLHARIANLVDNIPCKHVLLGIDACYSGSFMRTIQPKGDIGKRPGETDTAIKERFIQDMLQYKSRLVITSGGEVPTKDNSQFARQILTALRSRTEGNILDFYSLISYLQSARPTPRHGEFGDNEAGGQFLFVHNGIPEPKSETIVKEISTDLADWNAAKAVNTLESYEAYLKKRPSGDFAEAAAGKITVLRETAGNEGLVFVEGGTFTMGCTLEQGGDCGNDETPSHQVTLSDFYIGKYEVTQAEWRKVMGSDPPGLHNGGCGQCPVETVSWNDVQEFLRKLNVMLKKGQKPYRLPTEAEWEYAARGGAQCKGYKYAGSNYLDDVAWFSDNYKSGNTFGFEKTTRPVGLKAANEIGVYDMSGNVWEWCADWKGEFSHTPQTNPVGPSSGSGRIFRGGSWSDGPGDGRVALRDYFTPVYRRDNIGFRIARTR